MALRTKKSLKGLLRTFFRVQLYPYWDTFTGRSAPVSQCLHSPITGFTGEFIEVQSDQSRRLHVWGWRASAIPSMM
jgi:hypothetical protein